MCCDEREALQRRIDKALAMLVDYDGYGAGIAFHDSLRAALQGDQPAEPAWTLASPQAAPSVQASGEAAGGAR